MRILAFGDLHMQTAPCRHIPQIEHADLLLATGDLTNRGGAVQARQVIAQLQACNPQILAQFGNFDRPAVNQYLEDQGINLHQQVRIVGDCLLVLGLGGSNPTPFATPSEFPENTLTAMLDQLQQQVEAVQRKRQQQGRPRLPELFVSHCPPADCRLDRIRSGRHVGSTAVRTFIEKQQPELCVCGHIHESKGADQIGRTLLFNPGAFGQGGWLDIHVDQKVVRATLQ